MIVVRVELHSAVTGKVTEIARTHICNIGGTARKGNYHTRSLRGRDRAALDENVVQRRAVVLGYPRLSLHVWHLVARALIAMGYAGKNEEVQVSDIAESNLWTEGGRDIERGQD